jgi:hypothetical protein
LRQVRCLQAPSRLDRLPTDHHSSIYLPTTTF